MKQEDVAYISEQFGIEKEIVEASVNDGTLSARMKDAMAKKVIYSADEFEKFKTNLTAEAQTKYFNDLVEKAKKGDIPTELYKPVKGSSLQQKEREYSKKYEITEFQDLDDLIDKVILKSSANGKPNTELEKQINELKSVNLKLAQEKEEALKTVEEKYRNQIIEREKLDAINKIPFDFSGVKSDDADKVRSKTHTILKSVFDAEYKMDYDDKGRLIVKDREGNVKKNSATLDPIPVNDVMIELAKEYNLKLTSPDTGGQGGQSSHQSSTLFATPEDFYRWCDTQSISPHSKEALEMWRKSMKK